MKFALSEDNPALKLYLKAIFFVLHNDGREHASKVALIVCILFVSFKVRSRQPHYITQTRLTTGRIFEDIPALLFVTSMVEFGFSRSYCQRNSQHQQPIKMHMFLHPCFSKCSPVSTWLQVRQL